jgi:aryl-alcohol dehydrogenase-like predicted oxidoreductase
MAQTRGGEATFLLIATSTRMRIGLNVSRASSPAVNLFVAESLLTACEYIMEYVRLGYAGVQVSRICLGCLTFGNEREYMIEREDAKAVIDKALDLGINFFDTANSYSHGRSEEITGELLGPVREDVVIATKVYSAMGDGPNQRGLSRKHVMQQVQASLRRLNTSYIDLYQIHRWDYETPITETLATLNTLVRQGRVRYIGASSMWTWQLAQALAISDRRGYERFISMQNVYNLLYREEEREMIPLCQQEQIAS